ncbi:MAG: alkaline phosphatase family protein [Candidatus Sumerlaeaceae bacterium]|nr:alkaline phosphatase family protein [Candidatus Sumerlaeaceae bacterium]
MVKRIAVVMVLASTLFCEAWAAVNGGAEANRGPVAPELSKAILDHKRPKLAVLLVFDQLTAEYLTRFSDQFLPAEGSDGKKGGFRWLQEKGAYYADAHYTHVPTFTGPGHATIMSGANLADSGIIANDWVTSAGLNVNCVGDPNARVVGAPISRKLSSASPVNLQVSTVGDELRLSNNGQSKVIGIAIKDRGAILPSGRNSNATVWFDSGVGKWITSSYYGEALPGFAERANREKLADRWVGEKWDYLLPKENYNRSHAEGAAKGETDARGLGTTFPKIIAPDGVADKEYYERLIFTPYGNALTFETAKLAVEMEKLGQSGQTDLLTVSCSSPDLAGHSYGPQSPEMQDMVLRTDRQISDFLNFLDKALPGGLADTYVILTSDHAVAPMPDWAADFGKLDGSRILYSRLTSEAKAALAERFPDKTSETLVTKFGEPYLYLHLARLADSGIDRRAAQEAIADRLRRIPGVYTTYTRYDIEHGLLPKTSASDAIYNGFHPERSGEVLVLCEPFKYASSSSNGTTHGSRFNYDTHVPILFCGNGIKPGTYAGKVDVRDIAPTLSFLLGIKAPSGSTGRVLDEMLR